MINKARIFAMMRLSSANKLTVSQENASAPLRPRSFKKLRYFSGWVKLPSNDSYGSSLSLFGRSRCQALMASFNVGKSVETAPL